MNEVRPANRGLTSGQAIGRQRRVGGETDTLIADLYDGIRSWPMWINIGTNDIRQRYRRSVLGPLWITLSMAILVGTLGIIYSKVFNTNIDTYLPFLCLGFVIWGFISSTINECCLAFHESQGIIKQIKVPFSIHVLRVVWRNFIVFLHTIIIFIPIALIFGIALKPVTLLAVPGFALLYLNGLWIGMIVALLSSRFHDVPLIVGNLVQITFFATPILWRAESLGDKWLIADVNPMHHLIELVRAPLLGKAPEIWSWLVAIALLVVGLAAAVLLFRRVSRRIVYWL
jgi:ABC-type polysaccharide/polyol phosphate export permease